MSKRCAAGSCVTSVTVLVFESSSRCVSRLKAHLVSAWKLRLTDRVLVHSASCANCSAVTPSLDKHVNIEERAVLVKNSESRYLSSYWCETCAEGQ